MKQDVKILTWIHKKGLMMTRKKEQSQEESGNNSVPIRELSSYLEIWSSLTRDNCH